MPPIPAGDVVSTMRAYDALVVPSMWMETGPLVVPEALAAGIPVLASNHGGIPSFLRNGVDGLLLPPGDISAWATAFRRLVHEPGLLARLTAGVRPPETMDRVIDEIGPMAIASLHYWWEAYMKDGDTESLTRAGPIAGESVILRDMAADGATGRLSATRTT